MPKDSYKACEIVPFGYATYECCKVKTCKRCKGKGYIKRRTYKLKRFLDSDG